MSEKKFLCFDFNGTILNDNWLWKESSDKVFHAYGKEPPTVREYFEAMEGDWKEVYVSRGVLASADEMNAIYIPHYEQRMYEPKLFENVRLVLEVFMWEMGHKLGLITGQPKELVLPILEKQNLLHFFEEELISYHNRNKHETIQEFVIKSGVHKDNCYYIGDAPSDIKHGNKAGVKTVAFLNGFMPEDLVMAKKPTHTIKKFAELLRFQ